MLKGTKNELLGKFLYTNISATGIVDPGITHLRPLYALTRTDRYTGEYIYTGREIDTHVSIQHNTSTRTGRSRKRLVSALMENYKETVKN